MILGNLFQNIRQASEMVSQFFHYQMQNIVSFMLNVSKRTFIGLAWQRLDKQKYWIRLEIIMEAWSPINPSDATQCLMAISCTDRWTLLSCEFSNLLFDFGEVIYIMQNSKRVCCEATSDLTGEMVKSVPLPSRRIHILIKSSTCEVYINGWLKAWTSC